MITFPLETSPASETRNPTQAATSSGRIARPCGVAAIAGKEIKDCFHRPKV